MPTCPNCGEIIMNGDPYCPHCGTTFRWTHDEEDSQGTRTGNLKMNMVLGKSCWSKHDFISAFRYISSVSRDYHSMTSQEKAGLGYDPFARDWVVDTCCELFNWHDDNLSDVIDIINKNAISVMICDNCERIYPPNNRHCIICGKHLHKSHSRRTDEQTEQYIRQTLEHMFVDDESISRLVSRTLHLIHTKDCRFVEIRDNRGIEFLFIKENEYFYTRYLCQFIKGYYQSRIFDDCVVDHNYDNLLSNPSFKRLVKRTEDETGFKFDGCSGGYDIEFDYSQDLFTFTDDYRLKVRFDMGDGRVAIYDIDLDTMQLSDEYIAFDV